jgi:hypothetical protein
LKFESRMISDEASSWLSLPLFIYKPIPIRKQQKSNIFCCCL